MACKQIKAKATPNLRMLAGGDARKAPSCLDLGADHIMRYELASHVERPHVLKFSGGRSSGMLLLTLLHNNLLDRERGDVVVFNNTSAEHPATYAFVAECKRITEKRYGIPFLWLEFQTYEDVGRAGWTRYPSYRLVKSVPRSRDQPDGYDYSGAVFEETLAWKGYVPNVFSRTCTETMKLFVTSEFMRDWLGNRNDLFEQGHFMEKPYLDDRLFCRQHQRNGGSTPNRILAEKKRFLNTRPTGRKRQRFIDYTSVALGDRRGLFKNVTMDGGRAVVCGEHAVEYVSLVGFRADEPHRIAKMRSRNIGSIGEGNGAGLGKADGEFLYAPLEFLGVGRKDVEIFWKNQSVQLQLPYGANYSNCVFCFLKGKPELIKLAREQKRIDRKLPKELRSRSGTPSRLEWWIEMDRKYARDLRAERRIRDNSLDASVNPSIGFFGVTKNGSAYEHIRDSKRVLKIENMQRDSERFSIDCACTD